MFYGRPFKIMTVITVYETLLNCFWLFFFLLVFFFFLCLIYFQLILLVCCLFGFFFVVVVVFCLFVCCCFFLLVPYWQDRLSFNFTHFLPITGLPLFLFVFLIDLFWSGFCKYSHAISKNFFSFFYIKR